MDKYPVDLPVEDRTKIEEAEPVEVVLAENPRFPKPKPPKETKPEKAPDPKEIARILICGDFGGMARHKVPVEDSDDPNETEVVEVPCSAPSSFGVPGSQYGITPGRCWRHTETSIAKRERLKAKFLEHYIKNPELGITAAAEAAGMASRSDIYWWKEHDPEFRDNMNAIAVIAEAILIDQVEEMVHQAILDWRPGAGVLAQWYLANRRGYRWKPMGKAAESNDAPTGPTFQGGKHVHVWKMGDQTLTF